MSSLRLPSPLVVGLVLLAAALAPTGAAAAAGPLKSDAGGLCADVEGGLSAPATPVVTWTCATGSGRANQAWELTAAQELRTLGGTRCLDAYGGFDDAGTPLISFPCTGGANQKWRYRADRTIVGVQSGLCVDVEYGSTAPGSRLQLYPCHALANQRWSTPAGVDITAPTPPGSPKISALACRSATLAWTASTDAVGVAFYDVFHDGQLVKTVSGSTLSTSLTLNPGAMWGFYVNARDAAGNVSQASPTLTVTIPQCSSDTQAPTVPSGLTGSVAGTAATLRWTASTDNVGVTAYDVYRGSTKVGSTAGLTYTDSGLTPRTAYAYSVLARDAQGNASARSAAITLTTGAACSTAVCSATQVTTDTDLPWGLVAPVARLTRTMSWASRRL